MCITLFTVRISARTVIKAKSISIIHKIRPLSNNLLGLKVIPPGWLCRSKKYIFPHDLFVANIMKTAAPELFIFTTHAVKHEKTVTN